jgi:SAM-dependent methyltransferase
MSKEFGLTVSGIEFTADGAAATERNLQLQGVTPREIHHADFLTATPAPIFDVVVSFGFVEHFTELREVICRHAAWTRPGGRVIIGVPNFRGIHGLLQTALDRDVLERHNLEIMQPARLKALGAECGLVVDSVEYLGSLEPSLPIARRGVRGPSEFMAKLAVRAIRLLRRAPLLGKALDRVNNGFLSAYILASYGKPA